MNDKIVETFNENNETFKISFGDEFNTMWNEFCGKLRTTLIRMNYRERLVKTISLYSPIHCKDLILQQLESWIGKFEQYILNRLFRPMDNYSSDEIKEIKKALKSESFFNLTDENINPELIQNLKLGKKYSPKQIMPSTQKLIDLIRKLF